MSEKIRTPRQSRAIDKKNRIVEAGYELFAQNGYYKTNTVEIAKKAGVSTGIVYGYFHDKHDILLDVLALYVQRVFNPIFEMLDSFSGNLDFAKVLPHVVGGAVKAHEDNRAIHEALHSLSVEDEQVNKKFIDLEAEMTEKFSAKLSSLGYNRDDLSERVHLAMETIQSYAHECVYDKHAYLNYDKMQKLLIAMLLKLFD